MIRDMYIRDRTTVDLTREGGVPENVRPITALSLRLLFNNFVRGSGTHRPPTALRRDALLSCVNGG